MPFYYICTYDLSAKKLFDEYPKNLKTYSKIIQEITESQLSESMIVEDKDHGLLYGYTLDRRYNVMLMCVSSFDTQYRKIKELQQGIIGTSKYLDNPKILENSFKYHNKPENDKITAVQMSIESAKQAMENNIAKVIERGDQLDVINRQSESLQANASAFDNKATELKKQMCMNNVKMKIMILSAVFFFGLIIYFIVKK